MSIRQNKRIWTLCMAGALSALAFVLMFLELSLPFLPPFLKLDFSELPALLASFALGPVWGVVVCLCKNLLHLTVTQTGGIGELSNFLLGCCFVLPAGLLYKKHRSRGGALFASFMGNLSMAALCIPINLWVIYPLYYRLMIPEAAILGMCQTILPSIPNVAVSILVFNLPLTFGKGLIDLLITFVLYKKVSPILKGTWR